jgi:UDP-N-acetylmuramoylalanine--D-glutamate ligase
MPNGWSPKMSFTAQLKGKNCLVIGAGVTGMAVAKVLNDFGANVHIFDEKDIGSDKKVISSIQDLPKGIELAIVSPGWRSDHPLIQKLSAAGVQIQSEIDLAWSIKCEIAPNQRWVALTGTNGKTTSIQMLQSIFTAAGMNAVVCGNVGEPVITAVCHSARHELLALELSSFQIHWSNLPMYESIAILNIAQDHIDWHGTFEEYAKAKLKLMAQSKQCFINKSDPYLAARHFDQAGVTWFSLNTPAPGEIGLVEELIIDRAFSTSSSHASEIAEIADVSPTVPHNILNAMAAAALALSIGISYEQIKAGLSAFTTDHHRLELIKKSNEINWIDDSKATNPHAAAAAIMANLNVIWIAGGLAKGASMDELVQRCAPRIKSAILIGKDRDLIKASLNEFAPQIPIHLVDQEEDNAQLLLDVVKLALKLAKPGDTVLLAPACASMDQFKSYAQRGELFAKAVRELA